MAGHLKEKRRRSTMTGPAVSIVSTEIVIPEGTNAEKTGENAENRGTNVSQKPWKRSKNAANRLIGVSQLKPSFLVRNAEKERINKVKAMEKEMKDEKKREIDEKNRRRKEERQRKLENERKGEVVQVIKNVSKLKKMNKKQLKYIRKAGLFN
eukprot:comp7908_c0_seq1/m.8227 comp7908_c0_seq1/g.8227  ORF comp7908_c0_seq1/g.8227 comp7908_c0_seq1/m.8227 type:complete len:153 (-) comp7908_c0_seq1:44-502(-)